MEWFLNGSHKFLYHVKNNNGLIAGYIGGFSPQYYGEGSTSGMLQFAMWQGFLGVITHPWILFQKEIIGLYPLLSKNIVRKFLKSGKQVSSPGDEKKFEKRLGVVAIGVHPEHRGKGVFEMLMNIFETEARQRGISKLILSVKKDNARAINAYKKMRWEISAEKDITYEMIKTLTL